MVRLHFALWANAVSGIVAPRPRFLFNGGCFTRGEVQRKTVENRLVNHDPGSALAYGT